MKGLALEIIFKWVLISFISLVVIGLIFLFSGNIKDYIKNAFSGNDLDGAILIESPSFTSSQLRTFIKACLDKNPGNYTKVVCYVLKGDVSNVESNHLTDAFGEIVDVSKFDNSKNTVVIKKDGRKIVVESL